MKKSRLFLAFSTLILAACAMFASKANRKFTGITTGYIHGATNLYIKVTPGIFTSGQSGLKTVFATLSTTNGTKVHGTLVTSTSSTNKVQHV